MNLVLTDEQARALQHALAVYLSNLREEIVKTEKHEWKVGLHKEQETLQSILGMLE